MCCLSLNSFKHNQNFYWYGMQLMFTMHSWKFLRNKVRFRLCLVILSMIDFCSKLVDLKLFITLEIDYTVYCSYFLIFTFTVRCRPSVTSFLWLWANDVRIQCVRVRDDSARVWRHITQCNDVIVCGNGWASLKMMFVNTGLWLAVAMKWRWRHIMFSDINVDTGKRHKRRCGWFQHLQLIKPASNYKKIAL